MRLDAPSSAELAPILAGPVTWEPVVTSWLGSKYLGEVPVDRGSVAWSKGREVPGSLDLTVPRLAGGRDWRPGSDPEHPLGRFGQTLHVELRVGAPVTGRSWTIRLGTFLITATSPGPGSVQVTGTSMMQRIVDAKLRSPMPSRDTGTLASELRRLVPADMSLIVDPTLVDRPCPAMSWGESRVDAIREVVAAWPARLLEDAWGALHVLPPLPEVPVPVGTLTDGEGGTLVGAYEDDTRDGSYNVVVARGTDSDDAGRPTFQAEAQIEYGPMAVSTYYESVAFFSSPLLTSFEACQAAAATRLADLSRPSRTLPVSLAPDPRWDVDDAVDVVADGVRWWGFVSGVQIPLTPADGDMRLDVEVTGSSPYIPQVDIELEVALYDLAESSSEPGTYDLVPGGSMVARTTDPDLFSVISGGGLVPDPTYPDLFTGV